jgi:hypothetical protein
MSSYTVRTDFRKKAYNAPKTRVVPRLCLNSRSKGHTRGMSRFYWQARYPLLSNSVIPGLIRVMAFPHFLPFLYRLFDRIFLSRFYDCFANQVKRQSCLSLCSRKTYTLTAPMLSDSLSVKVFIDLNSTITSCWREPKEPNAWRQSTAAQASSI